MELVERLSGHSYVICSLHGSDHFGAIFSMDHGNHENSNGTGPDELKNALPVLVVEDNGLNQKVAILLLKRLGYAVEIANNGQAALEAVAHRSFCVILMDCHMPEMDGFEATAAIRAQQAALSMYTPIIAVTALTNDGDRERCLDAGMDDYIAKPIEKDLLKEKIEYWLAAAESAVLDKVAAQNRIAGQREKNAGEALNFDELEEFYGRDQLSEMLQRFMNDTLERILMLEDLIRDREAEQVMTVTSKLKNACDTIGAKQLSRICQAQQEAAKKADWVEASQTLLSLQRSFARSKNWLQCGIITEENSVII